MKSRTFFERDVTYRLLLAVILSIFVAVSFAFAPQVKEPDLEGCTSILVGRLASVDGSTMTSHSCDSGSDRTWISIVPHKRHKKGDNAKVYMEPKETKEPDDPDRMEMGEIPQVRETYKFMNTAYPIMNEHQLAIGETTTGGKRELRSEEGLINAPELYRLVLERAKTAREAIKVADELTKEYGYNDWGECFTFADPQEVWHFEILGPGKGKIGAVWAAVRIPDDEIGVSANAHRIRQLDLKNKNYFMASKNVFSLAEEMGWWDPKSGRAFEFCYAYANRNSLFCRRREWRVLSLLAPSLKLDPNSENYPFSVKPDKKVSVRDILSIFRDSYEGTEFDMTKDLIVQRSRRRRRSEEDQEQKIEFIKSPIANPFMSTDMRTLLRITRERTICSPAATYLQITQSRGWLPDEIGGVVWLGYDNPATTPHIPFYIGIEQMPESYMVDGRERFRRDCAWWAFRRASKLSYFRYQEMKGDVEKVWKAIEDEVFAEQEEIEKEALRLYKIDPSQAREFLTEYCHEVANGAVGDYWKLGDDLWSKYNRSF